MRVHFDLTNCLNGDICDDCASSCAQCTAVLSEPVKQASAIEVGCTAPLLQVGDLPQHDALHCFTVSCRHCTACKEHEGTAIYFYIDEMPKFSTYLAGIKAVAFGAKW